MIGSGRRLLRLGGAIALTWLAALAPGHALAADAVPAACPPTAASIDAEQFRSGLRDAVADHGFLWRIERDGHVSYLYGTIHLANPGWMYPGTLTKQAIAASDTVALELDILDPAISARLGSSLTARAGDALPVDLAERLGRAMVAECMDPAQYAGLTPEFQAVMLSMSTSRRLGVDSAYGIDGVLALAGRMLAKNVLSLETPESQAALLRSATPEKAAETVRGILDGLDGGHAAALTTRMVEAWRTSDFATLEDYPGWCECLRDDAERAAMKAVVDDRNLFLAAKIDALHTAGQSVFAAVGSLHMLGPVGLPALMRERGFRVEPIVPGR